MPTLKFTPALRRFFPNLREIEVEATTVKDALQDAEKAFPGILTYLMEDGGRLRKHVNIFVGGELIKDRETLEDPLARQADVLIFQALSGG